MFLNLYAFIAAEHFNDFKSIFQIPYTTMIYIKKSDADDKLQIYEFQGNFENIQLFDGEFDSLRLIMKFPNFYLQGKKIEKKFTIYEKIRNEIVEVGKFSEVILFDLPPRYVLNSMKDN